MKEADEVKGDGCGGEAMWGALRRRRLCHAVVFLLRGTTDFTLPVSDINQSRGYRRTCKIAAHHSCQSAFIVNGLKHLFAPPRLHPPPKKEKKCTRDGAKRLHKTSMILSAVQNGSASLLHE